MSLNLVIFPLHDWKKCEKEGFRTRDAHLILEFEKNPSVEKILIIDRPISLVEMLLKKYWWRVKNGEVIYKKKNISLTQVSKKIFVLDILSFDLIKLLILRKRWWNYIFKKSSIIKIIKFTIQYLKCNDFVLFLWHPYLASIIGKLGENMVVFDALDNWTKHPEINEGHKELEKGYAKIKKSADIIFTNSKALESFMATGNLNVFCITNGVDVSVFKPSVSWNIPNDLRNITHPVIGYAGKLAQRIDVELLRFLSIQLPDISFVLIGPILNYKWIKPLCRLKNIYLLGDKHYSLLPDYLKTFDICMIPHNVGELENDGNPIKLYEYLAVGKPVVTTNIAGVDIFSDIITIAKTKEEFLGGIKKYIKELNQEKIIPEKLRNSISLDCYWSNKAHKMVELITNKMGVKVQL